MNRNSIRVSWSIFNLQIAKELIAMIVLLVLTAYVVYFTSQNFASLFFLLLLLLFLLLDKNYFWFAYFFILAQAPGFFFSDFYSTSQYRLPAYSFLPGFTFTPLDFFVLLAFCKAIIKGKRTRLYLEGPLGLLFLYMVLVIAITSIFFSTPSDTLAWNLRWFFYYSIIISFLYLVHKRQEVYRFMLLVFPVTLFILFTQIYFGLTGNEFINVFYPSFWGVRLNTVTGTLRPVMGGALISFFSFAFSAFLLVNDDCGLPKIYLYIIMVAALLSVFLSATRLWFVIFSLIFAGFILVSKKKILSTIGFVSILLVVVSILMYYWSGPLSVLLQSSWLRLQQVLDLAMKDAYSVDTARFRLVYGVPKILEIIKQNPFIGYGFSDITVQYYDIDLGFFNTILMFGVIGFSLFLFFFIRVFAMLMSSARKISARNPFRLPLKIMIFTWTGILIAYFSTWDLFSMYFPRIFFVSLFIACAEFFVRQAHEEDVNTARYTF